jgi:hypothetical protein
MAGTPYILRPTTRAIDRVSAGLQAGGFELFDQVSHRFGLTWSVWTAPFELVRR